MEPTDIKRLRKKMGLNQTEFGEIIGKGYRTIQTYESGQSVPGGDAMLKLKELYQEYFGEGIVTGSDGDNNLYLTKEGVKVTMRDIVDFADKNHEAFFNERYFKREIEIKVAKKLFELSNDPEKLKEFISG